jgi:hypothetical protein
MTYLDPLHCDTRGVELQVLADAPESLLLAVCVRWCCAPITMRSATAR